MVYGQSLPGLHTTEYRNTEKYVYYTYLRTCQTKYKLMELCTKLSVAIATNASD